MNITNIKDADLFIQRVMKENNGLYIYGGGAYMWQAIMSGELDTVLFQGYNWRDKIVGYIDRNPQNRPAYLAECPFYNIADFQKKEKDNKVFVFVCIGMAVRHTKQYDKIIDDLKRTSVEIELMTIYDAVIDSKYYRKSLGIIEAPGIYKVIDFYKYIQSVPWYFHKLYDKCNYFMEDIGKDIIEYRNNCAATILENKQIGLRDNRGFINVINGRRVTYCKNIEHENKIHIFGDSRMLCIFVNDLDTIASMLQDKIYKNNVKNYRVLNYAMPSFEIERIYYQILNVKYKEGDTIVIEGKIKMSLMQKSSKMWFQLMKAVCKKCEKEKLHLVLLHVPGIYELEHLTYIEKHILDINSWIILKSEYENGIRWKEFRNWCNSMNVEIVDMVQFQEERYNYGEVYIDTLHYGRNGNEWISDNLYNGIRSVMEKQSVCYKQNDLFNVEDQELIISKSNSYFSKIENYENNIINLETKRLLDIYLKKHESLARACKNAKKTGAIVMNCNPFTLGHRYLIEQSSKKVDILIIFVVEENKSFFDIEDRLELVKKGCSDLDNVVVVPSGKFMISTLTFPEYFMKEELGDTFINPTTDLVLFGKYIAPFFNVDTRFVGEEPFDPITRQYNNTMREVLEDYGVRVTIIPRKESDGTPISASLVRRLLERKSFEQLKQLVPDTTYNYLIKHFG